MMENLPDPQSSKTTGEYREAVALEAVSGGLAVQHKLNT
jgi:hypothetical protein